MEGSAVNTKRKRESECASECDVPPPSSTHYHDDGVVISQQQQQQQQQQPHQHQQHEDEPCWSPLGFPPSPVADADAGDASPVYSPPPTPPHRSSNDQPNCEIPEFDMFTTATIALNSYNSTHQCHFELERMLYMEEIVVPSNSTHPLSSYYHLSFIAKSKDSSRKLKLFFAEVLDGTAVNTCTPVEPGNPLFPLGCGECHPEGVIYHPFEKYKVGGRRYYNSPNPWNLIELEESAKNILSETYIFKDIVQDLYPEEDKELREITHGYALSALAWYEGDKKHSYKLLELLASVRFGDDNVITSLLDSKRYVHLNFTAIRKDPICIDAAPELFFAEFNLDYSYVTTCINLTETSSSLLNSEDETSCLICSQYCPMSHPKG